MHSSNLYLAIRWREDVQAGEMIQSFSYSKTHLTLARPGGNSISQKELDVICEVANRWWVLTGSNLRVSNHMGEIIPAMWGIPKKW